MSARRQPFFTASEARYLSGPLIQPRQNTWDFPERLREIIPLARWIQVLRGLRDESEKDLATEEEALGYLSCVSLEAPLDRDWADIFMYLGLRVFPRWNMLPAGQSAYEAIGLPHPIELNHQQVEDLRHFRRWLREKIEAHGRQPVRWSRKINHAADSESTDRHLEQVRRGDRLDDGLVAREKENTMTDTTNATPELWEIPVRLIKPNPRQPRTAFDEATLHELAESIKEHGLIQPLIVSQNGRDDEYILLAGERRWRAAQIAGLDVVPCVVKAHVDDRVMTEIAIIENVQRENLSAADEARAYEQLATEFGLSDEQIGRRVGKDRTTIKNLRNLLALPPEILNNIGEGEGKIPQGTARKLVKVARLTPKEVSAAAKRILKNPDDVEQIVNQTINQHAITINHAWDAKWLSAPISATDKDGAFEIGACDGCPAFVNIGKTPYCTNRRCFEAKSQLFVTGVLERTSKKYGIPIAQPGEKTTVLELSYDTTARVSTWIKSKTKPDHLRLVANAGKQTSGWWHHRDLLGTTEVVLASTDPEALKRREKVEKPAAPTDETPAQRAKRIEKEEQLRAERREERSLARKQKADVSWLGPQAAKLLAPQLTISGSTLRYVFGFVEDRVRPVGHWEEMETAIKANQKASAGGLPLKDLEPLWREAVLLHLLNERISTYDPKQIYDWDRAVKAVEDLCTATELDVKLPKGWDLPPIHQTDSNCWVCGRFTPNDHITKIDETEGWQTSDGVVTCSDACRAKKSGGTAKSSDRKSPAKSTKTPTRK
ncbi:Chromosome-partitioning protein Spo0J [Planctomycetaceae bacterium]|nr:Chromosome-partitioning protein Spo0J [Planctomycetaceae bacterium]